MNTYYNKTEFGFVIDYNGILIEGLYSEPIVRLTGNPSLLSDKFYLSLMNQIEVVELRYHKLPDLNVMVEVVVDEGSNFFELDFSELNKSVHNEPSKEFIWS